MSLAALQHDAVSIRRTNDPEVKALQRRLREANRPLITIQQQALRKQERLIAAQLTALDLEEQELDEIDAAEDEADYAARNAR